MWEHPTPRQRAMPSALLSDHAACGAKGESDVGISHTLERAYVPGPPDPVPSALPNKKDRPFFDKLVLNASTRCTSGSNIVVQFGVHRAKLVIF
jgi:hypothetical protein